MMNWLPWRVGDHIKVYYDPVTEMDVEGDAHIVEVLKAPDIDGMGRYRIRLEDDTTTYVRIIKSYDRAD